MLNYLVFGIAIIIFAVVIIISGKAISRGIEAKQSIKDNSEDKEIALSDIEENIKNPDSNSSLVDQINDLNKLKFTTRISVLMPSTSCAYHKGNVSLSPFVNIIAFGAQEFK